MNTIVDDRNASQKLTHTWFVCATPRVPLFHAREVVAWACLPGDLDKVESWVRKRKDMKRVRIAFEGDRKYHPRSCTRFHIYAVMAGFPALKG